MKMLAEEEVYKRAIRVQTGDTTAQKPLLGCVRLGFDYQSFASEAGRVEDQAVKMGKKSRVAEVEAIKLLHEYQIVRATSPMLPGWLWKRKQKELPELWRQRMTY